MKTWGLTHYAGVASHLLHSFNCKFCSCCSTIDYALADLLIDFDMDIYDVNETEGMFLIEVELTSQIEREIQLLLMTKDGKATG